jgi:GNAT superfamily N-acetyltransferase
MTDVVIRRAATRDAPALSALSAATFTATFHHLYPPEDLAAFLAEAYALERTRAILADPAYAAWLAEPAGASGEAVGYALAGPCGLPHPEVTPACGELKRIYLLPGWQGGGRGSRLLALALGWLETTWAGDLWIGVWSGNDGARRLYGRLGFEKAGEYQFKVGRTLDDEYILRRRRAGA